jgi:hypothetical protein
MVAENTTFTRLTELATCLCAEFAPGNDSGLPGVCFCGIVSGAQPALDFFGNCDDACGMAWIRLATAQPSSGVGLENLNPGNCGSALGWDIEVGVSRCAVGLTADGRPPDEADYLTETQLQIADMLAMRHAIMCCSGSKNFIVGPYTPFGPAGNQVGGVWAVSMLEV